MRGNGAYSLGAQATLRGLSNEKARTLVLIDGIPINKGDTGEVSFNRIHLNEIEWIKIFKGPASSLYGNNDLSGRLSKKKSPGSFLKDHFIISTAMDIFQPQKRNEHHI